MKGKHFAGLDGLRFISITFVILHHLFTFKTNFGFSRFDLPFVYWVAFCGIRIFFIGSGFLITYLLLKELELHGKINFRNFVMRRILRIWPAYYLLVLLFLLFFKTDFFRIPGTTDVYLQSGYSFSNIFYLSFLPHWQPFFYPTAPLIYHTYTIGIEEQFYIVWGLLMRYFPKYSFTIFTGIVVSSPILNLLHEYSFAYVQSHQGAFPILKIFNAFVTYFAYSQFSTFAFGSLFAYAVFHKSRWVSYFRLRRVQFVVYSFLILFLITKFDMPFIGYDYVSILMGCVLVMSTFKEESIVNYSTRSMNYLGKISYGIYLFHIFAIVLACKLVGTITSIESTIATTFFLCLITLAISIALGSLSYHYFEVYFLKLKEHFRQQSQSKKNHKTIETKIA
ncbi:MAG: acyltransferase [Flavobacterium sp.]|nr:MAG: acyltransferase [Flavobacterium sp.]